MAKTRHFFAGSNSGKGFHSLFDNIIGPDARRIYLLKGGPGTGKSSFMRYISDVVGEHGYDRELFFCSSDSGALDAVSFPALGIALIDATAPHVIDAKLPGCRDQILALGAFWSKDDLDEKRAEIIAGGRIKQDHFASAFRYFAAALAIEENIAADNQELRDDCAKEVEEIFLLIEVQRQGAEPGLARHLFASALTPEGYVSHIQSLVQDLPRCFILQGGSGMGQEKHLTAILDRGQRAGYHVEAFHYPLNPTRLLHIVIPDLGLAVLTESSFESLDNIKGPRLICGPTGAIRGQDVLLWKELIERGFAALLEAQTSHIAVEEYYGAAMDFAALTQYRDEILAEILL